MQTSAKADHIMDLLENRPYQASDNAEHSTDEQRHLVITNEDYMNTHALLMVYFIHLDTGKSKSKKLKIQIQITLKSNRHCLVPKPIPAKNFVKFHP